MLCYNLLMSQEKKILGLNKNVFILGLVSMFNDMASEMTSNIDKINLLN